MARRKRARENFNAAGWADGLDLVLGLLVFVGALAAFFIPR